MYRHSESAVGLVLTLTYLHGRSRDWASWFMEVSKGSMPRIDGDIHPKDIGATVQERTGINSCSFHAPRRRSASPNDLATFKGVSSEVSAREIALEA
eukprot:3167988-Amphidinium_carterae.1